MTKKINSFKITMVAASSLLLFAAGCTSTSNQVKKQTHPYNANGPQMLNTPEQNTDYVRPQTMHGQSNTDNRIAIADKAAEKITKIPGITHANVLVTKKNAYVAAVLHNHNQMTKQIEDHIAREVRAVDPTVKRVYVSTNPEFLDRINSYVEDVRQGRPVSGFVEQFNEMIQRIFPSAR